MEEQNKNRRFRGLGKNCRALPWIPPPFMALHSLIDCLLPSPFKSLAFRPLEAKDKYRERAREGSLGHSEITRYNHISTRANNPPPPLPCIAHSARPRPRPRASPFVSPPHLHPLRLHGLLVLLVAPDVHDAPVDAGVQRLDAAVHHLREARVLGHLSKQRYAYTCHIYRHNMCAMHV